MPTEYKRKLNNRGFGQMKDCSGDCSRDSSKWQNGNKFDEFNEKELGLAKYVFKTPSTSQCPNVRRRFSVSTTFKMGDGGMVLRRIWDSTTRDSTNNAGNYESDLSQEFKKMSLSRHVLLRRNNLMQAEDIRKYSPSSTVHHH
ncbi:hypothetical protein WN51_13497 [Melipona quadrifasciata]|uniref:Uncharacterized protein n=1 Tax=Melipona quadrifasciata TaxID=166423 RepID=A0A0M9A281_9HYME|nr:hypothetical protein WN51_13497 [Melipona quadrifasciata]